MRAMALSYPFLLLVAGLVVPAACVRPLQIQADDESLGLGSGTEHPDISVQLDGFSPLPDWRPRSPSRERPLQTSPATVLAETGLATPPAGKGMSEAEQAVTNSMCFEQGQHPGDPRRYVFFENGVLGQGSYGVVFVAAEKASKRVVAVKSIERRKFQALELIPAVLRAPFLTTVDEVFIEQSKARIVMPLHTGKDLFQVLLQIQRKLAAEGQDRRKELKLAEEEFAQAEKALHEHAESWTHYLQSKLGQKEIASAQVESLQKEVDAKTQSLEVARNLPSNVMAEWHPKAKRLLAQVAYGLWEMHQRGMIHVDLKLENVALDGAEGTQAAILDFGLAELGCPLDGTPCCQTKWMAGTVVYSAAYACKEDYSFDMDFVSWAVMAFELLTGESLRCPHTRLKSHCEGVVACWGFVKKTFRKWQVDCDSQPHPVSSRCFAKDDPLVWVISDIILKVAEDREERRQWAKALASPRPEEHPVLKHYRSFGLLEEFGQDLRQGWHAFCQSAAADLRGGCRAADDEEPRGLSIESVGLCSSGAQNPPLIFLLDKRMGASNPKC